MVHGEIWPRETEKLTLPFTILTIGKKYECDQ